jgi:hypothetical protein
MISNKYMQRCKIAYNPLFLKQSETVNSVKVPTEMKEMTLCCHCFVAMSRRIEIISDSDIKKVYFA